MTEYKISTILKNEYRFLDKIPLTPNDVKYMLTYRYKKVNIKNKKYYKISYNILRYISLKMKGGYMEIYKFNIFGDIKIS